ncbi:MAG TPA: hypothetical protein VGK77_09600 [Candidatus Binatia bacterium]
MRKKTHPPLEPSLTIVSRWSLAQSKVARAASEIDAGGLGIFLQAQRKDLLEVSNAAIMSARADLSARAIVA